MEHKCRACGVRTYRAFLCTECWRLAFISGGAVAVIDLLLRLLL